MHCSVFHFRLSVVLAFRPLHLQILQSSRTFIKNPYAHCQLRFHLRTRPRLCLFLGGKSGTYSDTIPVPAEAIICKPGSCPGATTRAGRSCEVANPVHLRIQNFPCRQKLSICSSGSPPDTDTRAGRSYQVVHPENQRIKLLLSAEASEYDQDKFKHLTFLVTY